MSETAVNFVRDEFLSTEYGATLLGTLPFFKSFRSDELQRVYALGEIQVFNEAANIMVEGEESMGAYVILEGRVGVFKEKVGGERKGFLIATLGKGDSFGEISLLDRAPRSATVTAIQRTVLFYLDGEVWTRALDQDVLFSARFYHGFSVMLAQRLRALDAQYVLSQKQLWEMNFSRTQIGAKTKDHGLNRNRFVFKKHADAFVLDNDDGSDARLVDANANANANANQSADSRDEHDASEELRDLSSPKKGTNPLNSGPTNFGFENSVPTELFSSSQNSPESDRASDEVTSVAGLEKSAS